MVNIKNKYQGTVYTQKVPERFMPMHNETPEDKRLVSVDAVEADRDHLEQNIAKRSIDKFKTVIVDYGKNVLRGSGLQVALDSLYGKNVLVGFLAACPVEKDGHIEKAEIAKLESFGYVCLTEEDLTPEGQKEVKPIYPVSFRYVSHMHIAMAITQENYRKRQQYLSDSAVIEPDKKPIKSLLQDKNFIEKEYKETTTIENIY